MKSKFYTVMQKICLIHLDKIKNKDIWGRSPFLKRNLSKSLNNKKYEKER